MADPIIPSYDQALANAQQGSVSDAKKASVTSAAELKKVSLAGPEYQAQVITAKQMGQENILTEAERDASSMLYGQLLEKYGAEAMVGYGNMSGGFETVYKDTTADRGNWEVLGDTALAAAAGAAGIVKGVADLNTSAVETIAPEFMAAPSEALSAAAGWAQERLNNAKSDALEANRRQYQREREVQKTDNQQKYNADIAAGKGDVKAGLAKIGRETIDTAQSLIKHGNIAGDIAAESLPSTFAAGGAAKLLATGLTRRSMMKAGASADEVASFLGSKAGQEAVQTTMVKNMPLINGVLEGSGAVSAVRDEIGDMTEAELTESSAEYREMRKTMSHDEAKSSIMTNSSLMAGVMQGIMGGIAGKINAKFEAAPFSTGSQGLMGSLKAAGKNVITENIEEGVQGATGALAQNVAMQAADNDRSLTDDIGEGIATGIAASTLNTGGMQAPAVVKDTVGSAVNTAAQAAKGAVNAVSEASQRRLDNQIAEDDPLSDAVIQEEEAKVQEVINTIDTAEEVDPIAQDISNFLKLQEEDYSQIKENVKSYVQDEEGNLPKTKTEYVSKLSDKLLAEDTKEEDKNDIAIELFSYVKNLNEGRNDETWAERSEMAEVSPLLDKILYNPAIIEAVQIAAQAQQDDAPVVTEENIDSPEVDNEIKKAEVIATVNPMNTNREFVSNVLNQKRPQGRLNKRVKGLLAAGMDVQEILEYAAGTQKEINESSGIKATADIDVLGAVKQTAAEAAIGKVTADIDSDGYITKHGVAPSLTTHVSRVQDAVAKGDSTLAQESLKYLRNFAISQQNKLKAMDESAKNGGEPMHYQAYNPTTDSFFDTSTASNEKRKYQPMRYHKNSPGSTRFADVLFNDAYAATGVYNALVRNHEGLGEPLMPVPMQSLSIAQHAGRQARMAKMAEMAAADRSNPYGDPKPATKPLTGNPPKTPVTRPAPAEGEPKTPATPTPQAKAKAVAKPQARATVEAEATVDNQITESVIEDTINEQEASASTDEATDTETTPDEDTNDAEPVFEDEPEEDSKPAPKVTVKERFKNLFGNVFVNGFSYEKSNSNIIGVDSPLDYVASKLDDIKDEQFRTNYKTFIQGFGKEFVENFNNAVRKELGKKVDGKRINQNVIEAIQNNDSTPTAWNKWKILSLGEMIDGKFNLNQELMEGVALATFDWLANASPNEVYDSERIAKMLGINEEDIDADILKFSLNSIAKSTAVDDLSKKIMRFWGVKDNPDMRQDETIGLVHALASNAIDLLIEGSGNPDIKDKFLDRKEVTINGKTLVGVAVKRENVPSIKGQDIISLLHQGNDRIRQIVNPDLEPTYWIGQGRQETPRTQLRSSVPLSKMQREAIKFEDNIEYKVNERFALLVDRLGDTYKETLGYVHIDPNMSYNEVHLESIKGKNLSIEMGVNGLQTRIEKAVEYADENDMEYTDVPMFFSHEITSVGRSQMDGPANVQSDKTVREGLISTWSTLDMTTDEGKHSFWLTVGQMGDVVKPHQIEQSLIAEIAESKIRKKYPNTIAEYRKLLKGEEVNHQAILSEMGTKATPMIHHALLSVATLDNTDETGLKEFRHALAFEADGVTNGPANMFVKNTTGPFTQKELEINERIGLNYGNEPRGYFRGVADKLGFTDLYQYSADKAKETFNGLQKQLNNKKDTKAVNDALMRFMRRFTPNGVEFTTEDGINFIMDMKRNTLKNPLTKGGYGAGAQSTANGILNDMMDVFYTKLTEVANSPDNLAKHLEYPEIYKDMELLFNNKLVFSEKKNEWFAIDSKNNISFTSKQKDITKFRLNKEQFEGIRDNLQKAYIEPITGAINDTMGSAMQNSKLYAQAINFKSAVLKVMFEKELAALRAAKGYKNNQLPTKNELKNIQERLAKYDPKVTIEAQNFDMGGYEPTLADYVSTNNKKEPVYISESLFGSKTGVKQNLPQLSGVKGGPFITIGTGDGYMMNLFYSNPIDGAERTLAVFDGMNSPADKINEISAHINEQVNTTWTQNVARPVSDNFNNFIREINLEEFTEAELNDLWEYAFPHQKMEGIDIEIAIQDFNTKLITIANDIDARIEARKSIGYSVDQMAGANQPFFHKGKVTDNPIEDLNKAYQEALKKNAEAPAKAIKDSNKALTEAVQAIAEPTSMEGVSKVAMKDLRQLMRSMTLDQRKVYSKVIWGNENMDYVIYSGSEDAINQFKNENFPSNQEYVHLGQIDRDYKVMFIADLTGETLLHEALHIALADKVDSYYVDPSRASVETREAIQRLEAIREETLERNYSRDPKNVQQAILDLINSQNEAQSQAESMNEFLAWSLSNPHLLDVFKKSEVNSRLAKIKAKVINALKTMFGITGSVSNTTFDNILFNAQIVQREGTPTGPNGGSRVLNQRRKPSGNDRLDMVREKIRSRLSSYMNGLDKTSAILARNENVLNKLNSRNPLIELIQSGFKMNSAEQAAFKEIYAVVANSMPRKNVANVEAQILYDHIIKNLNVESFMDDPDLNDPGDRMQAQDKFNAITGVTTVNQVKDGTSNLIPMFVALSQTSDTFRTAINKIPKVKSKEFNYDTLDDALGSITEKVIDESIAYMTGARATNNNVEAMDNLILELLEPENSDPSQIEVKVQSVIDKGDEKLATVIAKSTEWAYENLDEIRKKAKNKYAKNAVGAAMGATAVFSKKYGPAAAEALTDMLNTYESYGSQMMRSFFAEIRGRTYSNERVLDMLNKVKWAVSATREEYRNEVPKVIKSKFKKKMNEKDWTSITFGLAKADAIALMKKYKSKDIFNFFNNNAALNNEIKLHEQNHSVDVQAKAKELAKFNMTGEGSHELLMNASAIAMVFRDTDGASIDRLITLYSIQMMDKDLKKVFQNLIKNEADGLEFSLNYLKHISDREYAKNRTSNTILYNQRKGYFPAETPDGMAVELAHSKDHKKMVLRGYTKLKKYEGMDGDNTKGELWYYVSNVSGSTAYAQGVMQTVQQSQNGIDLLTGRTVNGTTLGVISGPLAASVAKRIRNHPNGKNGEFLRPVLNDDGKIVAFERLMDPEVAKLKQPNTLFHEMMGAWAGRQSEEAIADNYNEELVNNLKYIWDDQKHGRSDEFVNIAKSKDPVYQDIWKSVPRNMKDKIEEVFGDEFMVRKDMVNNALGYRTVSITDSFTGMSRLTPEVQKVFRDVTTGILGKNAFKYIKVTELGLQAAVSTAKELIVVKSVVVPMANILSNVLQLTTRGVPMRTIVTRVPQILTEINHFLKNRDEEIRLKAELVSATNVIRERQIRARLQVINDTNKKMFIYPLIEKGEFNTISEGLTEQDVALTSGKFMDWIEGQVEKLPEGVKTAGRYAIISKSTALYKGLNRSVQYGDFIAKAIRYDDALKREKKSKEDAWKSITEEFVNYNFLPGRERAFLESIGMMWFWNFKIRIMKTAIDMVRNNPLRSIMSLNAMATLPMLDFGSPLTDSLASMDANRLDYTTGAEMLFSAPSLNPWWQLVK